MKRCPTCNRTFTDRNLSFCIDDGTPLIPVPPDEDPTVVAPGSKGPEAGDPGSESHSSNWNAPVYQPPGSYVPPGSTAKRSTWPWVVAILGIVLIAVVGLGAAVAIMVPRFMRASANRNRSPVIVTPGNSNDSNSDSNPSSNTNANSDEGANSNGDSNANTGENLNPAPTDSAKVLSDLRDLEHEWTVANINADKKALDRILADDYVGTTDGGTQGKKQYLHDIQRDTSIEKWDFEDLKVDLKGDRAVLTGIVKFIVGGSEQKYNFTDKFVWRDGRWQATASQVDPVK